MLRNLWHYKPLTQYYHLPKGLLFDLGSSIDSHERMNKTFITHPNILKILFFYLSYFAFLQQHFQCFENKLNLKLDNNKWQFNHINCNFQVCDFFLILFWLLAETFLIFKLEIYRNGSLFHGSYKLHFIYFDVTINIQFIILLKHYICGSFQFFYHLDRNKNKLKQVYLKQIFTGSGMVSTY